MKKMTKKKKLFRKVTALAAVIALGASLPAAALPMERRHSAIPGRWQRRARRTR